MSLGLHVSGFGLSGSRLRMSYETYNEMIVLYGHPSCSFQNGMAKRVLVMITIGCIDQHKETSHTKHHHSFTIQEYICTDVDDLN